MTFTPYAIEHEAAMTPPQAPTPETFFGAFDDAELELALKTVGPDPRDLVHFLRSCRAQ
ncbi:MAG: hypothetical protein ACTHL8_23515 [Burkholderiaceae bacterium]